MAIRFHLPGFTRNYHLNMLLLKLKEAYPDAFYPDVEIASFYGEFPSSLWNGGRCLGGVTNEPIMKQIIDSINEKGISLRYTFTNPLINQSHLQDRHCNLCLRLANREDRLNGVIVVSPILEKHIRKHYPNYRIISSTCKQITEVDALCAELEQDYDLVVLDYNWNNQWDVLEQLPNKDRVEILVNAVCPPGCQRRRAHYQYLGRTQIKYCEHLQRYGGAAPFHNSESFLCPHINQQLYATCGFSTHVTPEDLYGRYTEMGFCNFKIEGRSSDLLNVMETYMYYLVKPECRDEIRLIYLLSLQQSKVIDVTY
ncbi:MAG: hypothetical protein IKM30_05955 [Oscillospiraceae bacterium]|nr:hypothetical protein [Oscillospiraceae bacterium]